MKKITALFTLVLLLISQAVVADEPLVKTFYPESYAKILKDNNGKEFTLVFWSVSCSPCIKELKLISETKMYVNQKFVFVAIDGEAILDDIIWLIRQLNLEQQEHWVFKSELAQEIINAVDKTWYGEVPRNYFFDVDDNRLRLRELK